MSVNPLSAVFMYFSRVPHLGSPIPITLLPQCMRVWLSKKPNILFDLAEVTSTPSGDTVLMPRPFCQSCTEQTARTTEWRGEKLEKRSLVFPPCRCVANVNRVLNEARHVSNLTKRPTTKTRVWRPHHAIVHYWPRVNSDVRVTKQTTFVARHPSAHTPETRGSVACRTGIRITRQSSRRESLMFNVASERNIAPASTQEYE